MTDYFPAVIGLDRTKKKLSFFLDSYKKTRTIMPILFQAAKGTGKTLLARQIARHLTSAGSPQPKTFLELNCSSIRNKTQFITQILLPYFVDKEVTVFLDEAHELPRGVSDLLLSILDPDRTKNVVRVEESEIEFDTTKHSWLFATTNPEKMIPALKDRFEVISLEPYTPEELGEIVRFHGGDFNIDVALLPEIVSVLRGNPRQAMLMVKKMRAQLQRRGRRSLFGRKDWVELKDQLDILPLGLNRLEIQILQFLREREETSLTNLSAKTGISKEALQREFESYLLKHSLIEIMPRGRSITRKGLDILREIEK